MKNIEETEKAKRIIAEERNDKRGANDEEAHLSAARCAYILVSTIHKVAERCVFIVYQPNLKAKSDADIIRDAKLAAMGLLPEEHEPRRQSERSQMATDEIVSIVVPCPFIRVLTHLISRSWSVSRSECENKRGLFVSKIFVFVFVCYTICILVISKIMCSYNRAIQEFEQDNRTNGYIPIPFSKVIMVFHSMVSSYSGGLRRLAHPAG